MTGLELWVDAGPNTRALFIRLACDGDARTVTPLHRAMERLTVAQALEVTK